jgi:hypothetical protein
MKSAYEAIIAYPAGYLKNNFWMKNRANRVCFNGMLKWLILLVILLVAVLLLLPAGNRLSKIQMKQFQSDTQLKGIARLVLAYERQHGGKMPQSLSELVSDDRTDLLGVFYAPNTAQSAKPAGWSVNKMILDKSSDYALPSHPNSDIVAFEKSGLWSDGTIAVCFTNLSVERLSTANFEALLSKKSISPQR